MVEDVLGKDERKDGSAGGDDNRNHVVTMQDVCQAFVAELARVIHCEDPQQREPITKSCGLLLESIVLGSVSILLDSLMDPEPRTWSAFFRVHYSQATDKRPPELHIETLQASTKQEATKAAELVARKMSTMDRRFILFDLLEGIHGKED